MNFFSLWSRFLPFRRKPKLLTAPEPENVQLPEDTSLTIDTKPGPPLGTQSTIEATPTLRLTVPGPAPVMEPVTPPQVSALSKQEHPSPPANISRPMLQTPTRPDDWLRSRALYFAAGNYSAAAHSDVILSPDLLFGLERQSNREMKDAPEHTSADQLPPPNEPDLHLGWAFPAFRPWIRLREQNIRTAS